MMWYTVAIVFSLLAAFCNAGSTRRVQRIYEGSRYGNTSDSGATDVLLHRSKRGWGSVLVYGTSVLLRAGSLGLSLAQAITGGCAIYPSICRDQDEIEKLDNDIKAQREKYDQKYLEIKRAYFDLRSANTDTAYIMYYMNETLRALQSLEKYQENIVQAFEIEQNDLYQRFEAYPNSTEYLSSLLGELEYSLSDIRKMIRAKKMNQGIGLLVQYLVEFSINRFVSAFNRAYNQVAFPEDIYGTSILTHVFNADPTDAAIMLDPDHPRYAEVMGKHAVPTRSRVTFKQKFKYIPKVLKKMIVNGKDSIKNLKTSIKKWSRIRTLQGFKGKLKHSLRGLTAKIKNVRKFVTSQSSRKYFVKNFKLRWSRGVMMAVGIIGDAVQIAVQTKEWKTVADEMNKARKAYEKYADELKAEFQKIIQQAEELEDQWPEIIESFKNLSLSFMSIFDNVEKYKGFSSVLGLPKLPVDPTLPLFSIGFKTVTKTNIRSSQQAMISFVKEVDNDVAMIADEMRARETLYENVLKMTTEEQSVQDMLDASHNIYKFSSSQTVKNFGIDLTKKDIVCTVAQLRKTKTEYDFFQLKPFRPRCNVSMTDFSNYDNQAGLQRQEQIMTHTVSSYNGNSLSSLLDRVHAAYRVSTDDDLQSFGNSITDQQVLCTVSKVYPSKQKFDYISLSPFRPQCSSISAADFGKMKSEAAAVRQASATVEGVMGVCEKFGYCPCPALLAQKSGVSESDVIQLIKTLRPAMSQYCGTKRCECVML